MKNLHESKTARWTVLILISLVMVSGYFFTDIMSPLKSMIERNPKFGWDSTAYGMYSSAYSWFNVFFLMLIFGGIILDKLGIRFTGKIFISVILVGASINYYAMSDTFLNGGFGYDFFNSFLTDYSPSVKLASLGYAIFGTGMEIAGIIASKVIVKWFKGKELALAMGLNTAFGRLGMLAVFYMSGRLAGENELITRPLAFGLIILIASFGAFLIYCFMERKFDKEENETKSENQQDNEEQFKVADLKFLFKNRGFIYISILCVAFYSAVFPFMKYAPDLMVNKFGVNPDTAGDIPGLLPLGTLILTPLFGFILDYKGKGASIMIFGSIMLIVVHLVFAFGSDSIGLAYALMIILGIAFSLVPASMWPAISKIVDERYLGSAYAVIFWIQNWGLMGMPLFIGYILDKYNPNVAEQIQNGINATYDYTIPMIWFAVTGVIGFIFSFMLKAEDKNKNYGLELPNKQSNN
ncbi:MAG: MFS transporter [Bacteroidales bacterium]|nr:MFS transporter [Bacteroidales bacterium]